MFSAHSTRRESATKAVGVGVKTQAILKTVDHDWASAGSFKIFYNRSSSSVGDCMAFFTRSVLSLGGLQLTNGHPASIQVQVICKLKFSDVQYVRIAQCTQCMQAIPDCNEAGCRQAYHNFHTLFPPSDSQGNYSFLYFSIDSEGIGLLGAMEIDT